MAEPKALNSRHLHCLQHVVSRLDLIRHAHAEELRVIRRNLERRVNRNLQEISANLKDISRFFWEIPYEDRRVVDVELHVALILEKEAGERLGVDVH